MYESGSNMEPFKKISSIVTPLDRVNVDTDQIVPKQFLKLVQRTGFGKFLFYNWRFDADDKPKQDFVLNNPKYTDSKIFLTQENFGCGSSREHAAWALKDYGFDVIIAPSFADIFYNNCFKNGILPITLDSNIVQELFKTDAILSIDLQNQTITYDKKTINFDIENFRKQTLLQGLDDIASTLEYEDKIKEYEKHHLL
jgi:3-isopropylmalate/(R)-2-methylmalate dehydratase small subunit